ncbi:hypothetical protein U1Q18_035815 [Sarracenia purpurea var. burkii]
MYCKGAPAIGMLDWVGWVLPRLVKGWFGLVGAAWGGLTWAASGGGFCVLVGVWLGLMLWGSCVIVGVWLLIQGGLGMGGWVGWVALGLGCHELVGWGYLGETVLGYVVSLPVGCLHGGLGVRHRCVVMGCVAGGMLYRLRVLLRV